MARGLFGPHLVADLFTQVAENFLAKLSIFLQFHEYCKLTKGPGKVRRKGRGLCSWEWLRCEGRMGT